MAYDASPDWLYAQPSRLRRWGARLLALLALVACGAGVYLIAREARVSAPAPRPATLDAELRQLAASTGALSARLQVLGSRRSAERARGTLREVRADHAVALAELRHRRARGPVRADAELGRALNAHGRYVATVGRALRRPSPRLAVHLRERVRAVRKAFAALPDDAGMARALRGAGGLVAYAEGGRG